MVPLPGRPGGSATGDGAGETRLRGISLSPGVAVGQACLYSQVLACPDNLKFHSETDRLKATLTNCIRHGVESQNRDDHPEFLDHLRGRVAFVTQVNPARGVRLQALFEQIA